MANKKNSKKDTEKVSRRKLLIITTIVAAILVILWAGWWLVFKHNVYSPDKTQVRSHVQSALDAATFSGKLAYNNLVDTGCDSGNSVGLATYVHCDFLAQKYFFGSGDVAASLRTANNTLAAAGWQLKTSLEDYNAVLAGTKQIQIEYDKDDQVLTLVFYENSSHNSLYNIRGLLDDGRISPLSSGEFIYGIRAYSSYWSCRSDSIFEVCPPSPSSPKP